MFKQYCEDCITKGMCFEQGLCVREMVNKALDDNYYVKDANCDLTEKAKMDHLLLMEDISRKKDAADSEDTVSGT